MSYIMDRQDVIGFMQIHSDGYREKGNEIEGKHCPICHGGSSADKYTFSVNAVTGAACCLRASCGWKGHFVQVCRDKGYDLGLVEVERKYKELPPVKHRFELREVAENYMRARGISKETAERYQITERKDNPTTLVFPFFTDDGKAVKFIKYRNTIYNKETSYGSKEWCEPGTQPILFGMQEATDTSSPLVITEGQIDSLSLAEAGIPNAVSVPTGANGFTWMAPCMDFLNRFQRSGIIVFGDHEHGKMTLIDQLRNRLPKFKIKGVRLQDYLGEKDANAILMRYGNEALIDAVNNAEAPKVSELKDISEVKRVDMSQLEMIETRIDELDKVLKGGFAMGQLVVLTGKRGQGKSTFMSQLICEALDQDYNVMAYSGELADFHFKNWLDCQLAGTANMTEYSDRFGEKYYKLPESTEAKLNDWYRGRLKLYDNEFIPKEGHEMPKLLDTVEKAAQAYGIKLVCIDNIMTAMEGIPDNGQLYAAQSQFVGQLKKLAIKYNMVVIMVAHPRKSKDEFDNDDVSGSADITNKADIVLNYSHDKDKEADSVLAVTKNRLVGKTLYGKNAIKLMYAPSSKRITSDSSDPNRKYGWEKTNSIMDGFTEVSNDEFPF